MLRWFCFVGDEPSQSRIRSTAPPRGELFCTCRFAMTERVYSPKTSMKKYTQIA